MSRSSRSRLRGETAQKLPTIWVGVDCISATNCCCAPTVVPQQGSTAIPVKYGHHSHDVNLAFTSHFHTSSINNDTIWVARTKCLAHSQTSISAHDPNQDSMKALTRTRCRLIGRGSRQSAHRRRRKTGGRWGTGTCLRCRPSCGGSRRIWERRKHGGARLEDLCYTPPRFWNASIYDRSASTYCTNSSSALQAQGFIERTAKSRPVDPNNVDESTSYFRNTTHVAILVD